MPTANDKQQNYNHPDTSLERQMREVSTIAMALAASSRSGLARNSIFSKHHKPISTIPTTRTENSIASSAPHAGDSEINQKNINP